MAAAALQLTKARLRRRGRPALVHRSALVHIVGRLPLLLAIAVPLGGGRGEASQKLRPRQRLPGRTGRLHCFGPTPCQQGARHAEECCVIGLGGCHLAAEALVDLVGGPGILAIAGLLARKTTAGFSPPMPKLS